MRRLGRGMSRSQRANKPQEGAAYRREALKMRSLVKKKKEECWKNFIEEQGAEDAWKVIRFPKDP